MDGQPTSARSHTDSAAIAASLEHPERFSVIFDRHYTAAHRYISRRAGVQAADDLASRTFVAAFESRHTFRGESDSALPWLLGIATNLLRERHRKQRRELGAITRLRAERVPGQAGDTDPSREQRLAEALATLDSRQLDVLALYVWAELSYEEIAQALDVPLGTVRSRLFRAREQLRAHLHAALTAPHLDPSQENT
jgi:RNA polymerase sigma-70 factor (ECF subfamily)